MALLVRIGTRGSRLALWQANHVASLLEPYASPTIVEIQTAGDQVRDVPLPQIGGEGVFTKEIQRALTEFQVDIAVHSLKDLPTVHVAGIVLAAVPPRGPSGDVFVSHRHDRFDSLTKGAVVATSSLRRRAQILNRRPDLQVVDIRGNVETRLRKLDAENLDGLILAQAGLERLELDEEITEVLDPSWMLPAVGQGALGLECRLDDEETLEVVRLLDDPATHEAIAAERAFLRTLQGGCQVPIGASAKVKDERLTLRCVVLDPQGKRRIEGRINGAADTAEELGRQLAHDLIARGAAELLA
ncbi:MAG TPA: hydroxymethylbilane synthase [Gemmataceae bacterium]|jgi:hydroxymethylbilane synthase|nr:hydroxymethylbilane synthase [Gemmataceae bacterium]